LAGGLAGLAGVALAAALVVACAAAGPRHRGPKTDHFDGKEFHNPVATRQPGLFDFLRWRWTRGPAPWTPAKALRAPSPIVQRVGRGELRVTFINHATVLLQMDGVNILTDPIWSERTSPVSWAGPRRAHPPGLPFDQLPPIDVVVVSHNHYDHCDLATLRRLNERHRPRFFVGLGNQALLEESGIFGAAELDWWQSAAAAPGVTVTSVPSQHFSGRGLGDWDRTLWTGFVFRGPAGTVYFAGDTARGPHFAEIRRRMGYVRLAVLPIGAYLPRWYMARAHISPAEAVEAHMALQAETSVAMHFGTFQLADETPEQAPRELRSALAAAKVSPSRFWVLAPGEARELTRGPPP
jgi:L-ascorbate metabolism protein UlaG (beta-lactamase superfamily)